MLKAINQETAMSPLSLSKTERIDVRASAAVKQLLQEAFQRALDAPPQALPRLKKLMTVCT
jgi:hypothetical protein